MALERVDRRIIESELRKIADALQARTTFVLFGGCNMSVRTPPVKDSTRDTDAVVYHERGIADLLADLETIGYEASEVLLPGDPFDQWVVVASPEGMSTDLFPPKVIFDRLTFSDRMRGRATHWFTKGNLRVELADLSTVFLLKSVTGRWRTTAGRDVDDLRSMLDKGLVEWGDITAEWEAQLRDGIPDERGAREHSAEAMELLRRAGYTVPWNPGGPA